MVNEFNKKGPDVIQEESLENLLRDVSDEKERARLTRVWNALGGLCGVPESVPPPSRELENIFNGVDEPLTDHELEMLAAAGVSGNSTAHGSADQDQGLVGGEGKEARSVSRDWLGSDVEVEQEDILADNPRESSEHGWGDDILAGEVEGETSDIREATNVFVFGKNDGSESIPDFNPKEDFLQFDRAMAGDIDVTLDGNGNTVITYGQTSVIIEGVVLSYEEVMARIAEN